MERTLEDLPPRGPIPSKAVLARMAWALPLRAQNRQDPIAPRDRNRLRTIGGTIGEGKNLGGQAATGDASVRTAGAGDAIASAGRTATNPTNPTPADPAPVDAIRF